jgi:Uma2 family endonuclease
MLTITELKPEKDIYLPEHTELVDGELVEKNGVTFQHSKIQSRLDYAWRNYMISSGQGGEVCVEVPCRTQKQVRRPDVAYITQELLERFGEFDILPQSFPLVAEVASPTDLVEDFWAKAEEYLESGCGEVWLIIPKVKYIFIITAKDCIRFRTGEVAQTQEILTGFEIAVAELLS